MPNNHQYSLPGEERLLPQLESPFKQSKDVVWKQLVAKMEDSSSTSTTKVRQLSWFKYAAAAAIAFLVCSTIFCKLYTQTISSERGAHLSYTLPDGSNVLLNAESSLQFHPYWWSFDRSVHFEGEGFFEVQTGANFTVYSEKGTTQVLGTAFNISTRNDNYVVFCEHGKVRVSSNLTDEKVILTANMFADTKDKLIATSTEEADLHIGWKSLMFDYKSKALTEVLEEVERQYNISIQYDDSITGLPNYTGNFKKSAIADSTLNLICQTYGLTFVKIDANNYKIKK